jgi:hypothetical protein
VPNTDQFELMLLRHSYEAFGMVIDLLSRNLPFAKFEVGDLGAAVRLQLQLEHHVGAIFEGRLIGYLGWLTTSPTVAEAWVAGAGPLTTESSGSSVALTIVVGTDSKVIRALISNARQRNVGKRVYFKRAAGQGTERKTSVLNRGAADQQKENVALK